MHFLSTKFHRLFQTNRPNWLVSSCQFNHFDRDFPLKPVVPLKVKNLSSLFTYVNLVWSFCQALGFISRRLEGNGNGSEVVSLVFGGGRGNPVGLCYTKWSSKCCTCVFEMFVIILGIIVLLIVITMIMVRVGVTLKAHV